MDHSLSGPVDFLVAANAIWILDSKNYVIKVFDETNRLIRVFPNPPWDNHREPLLKQPKRLFVIEGRAYVFDTVDGTNVLTEFAFDGRMVARHPLKVPGIDPQSGSEVGNAVEFFLANSWHRLRFDTLTRTASIVEMAKAPSLYPAQRDEKGNILAFLSLPGDGVSQWAFDPIPRCQYALIDGNVFKFDCVSNNIAKVDKTGAEVERWSLPFQYGSVFGTQVRASGKNLFVTARRKREQGIGQIVELWKMSFYR